MLRLVGIFLCFFMFSATAPKVVAADSDRLNLKWNKAYPDETIDKAALGLEWTLSFTGALLPNSPSGIYIDGDTIALDLNELGFNPDALQQLQLLHRKIKDSDEYKKTKAIDLGRYIALLIGSSEHYYALTGVPEKLSTVLSNYQLLPEKAYVNHSGVSKQHRIIEFSAPEKRKQLLISTEIDSVTKTVLEYETIEIIPNGQLRFGIYDENGDRSNSAKSSHSEAGKPAKCIWCHESKISQLFNKQDDFPLYQTYRQLQDKLIAYNQYLTDEKLQLKDGVRFSELQQHTLSELLYISFMEPSAERLSREWKLPIETVKARLSGLPTHVYSEFPFLGQLYHRYAVEKLAPFRGLPVSGNVREASAIEVNHLR